VHQRAAEADFLLHAARELAAGSIWETGRVPWLLEGSSMRRAPLGRALAEQATEEVDVVNTLSVG